MEIEVLKIQLVSTNKSLRAFADIRINDWIVFDFRVLKQDGQKAYVSSPQVSWKDPVTGQIKFKSVLVIPSEQKQRIDVEVLSAFQKKLEEINGKEKR